LRRYGDPRVDGIFGKDNGRAMVCEQAHQQLKEELGLNRFEGRPWQGRIIIPTPSSIAA